MVVGADHCGHIPVFERESIASILTYIDVVVTAFPNIAMKYCDRISLQSLLYFINSYSIATYMVMYTRVTRGGKGGT